MKTEPNNIVRQMASRFLQWPIPKDFSPDCGIEFTPPRDQDPNWWPIGTNLLNLEQAEELVRFMLDQDIPDPLGELQQTTVWAAVYEKEPGDKPDDPIRQIICYAYHRETAARIGRAFSLGDASMKIKEIPAVISGDNYLVLAQLEKPSAEDDALIKQKEEKARVFKKAKDLGLTDEEIRTLKTL